MNKYNSYIRTGAAAAQAYRIFKQWNQIRSQAVSTSKKQQVMSGYNSLSKARRRWGRKARQNLRQAWKILRVNRQDTIYRFQQVSQYDTSSGGGYEIRLKTNGDGTRDCPLHIYNLSSVINYNGTAEVTQSPARYMIFSGGGDLFSGTATFGLLPGQRLDKPGDANFNWQLEKTEQNATSNIQYPHAADQLNWVNVKLLLYGSQAAAIKYRIDFIQLSDQWLDPWEPFPSSSELGQDRNRFWFNMVKEYTYNPILTPQPRDLKNAKILRTYQCIIEPTKTDEPTGVGGAIVPHTKQLNIFYRMNRTQRYDWQDNTNEPAVDSLVTLENAAVEQITVPVNKPDVHPRARVFMVIRALSTVQGQTADYDIKYNPSYDIIIRKSHSQLSP